MPPKKRKLIGRTSNNTRAKQICRDNETDEQRQLRLDADRQSTALSRASETDEQSQLRLDADRQSTALSRASETDEQSQLRLDAVRQSTALSRASETHEQRQLRLDAVRQSAALSRASETHEQRQLRLDALRQSTVLSRASETHEQSQLRLDADSQSTALSRASETVAQTELRRRNDRVATANATEEQQRLNVISWGKAAMNYNPSIDYTSHDSLRVGQMMVVCEHCSALRWPTEPLGFCCSRGKVSLPIRPDQPQPLRGLLSGDSPDSEHFLHNIRRYNSAFQMTSFGANVITEGGFMPTFKVQGQIYHRIGSLLPTAEQQPRFLQVYFIDDHHDQANLRASDNLKPHLITAIQDMLHEHNSYITSFKYAIESNPGPNLDVVINADKKPSDAHRGRFNAPACNELAVVMTGQEHGARDIVIKSRDNTIRRICETHRSYDPLQYPLLCVRGEDGYRLGIQHAVGRKNVSCNDFYAYYFMVRSNSFNHLHRSRNLFNQFAVDMYAKVESERLFYIRSHQRELRADSYIHLRDSINNDQTEGHGQLCILPSSFTGSPRYMQEKTQDALTYVKNFGRPDLFVTFTCNPKWEEVKRELFEGQAPRDRHDVVARVFRLKLQKLMFLVKKCHIFGQSLCDMYTIEWQKRGLPHSHILIWLQDKIHADQIDNIISAELPDPEQDQTLYDFVKTHMVHGPCGRINPNSPCMKDGKCSKRYPRQFLAETQTSNEGYPLYRRRSPEDGGFTAKIRMRTGGDFEIDNRWIVPYCPLLTKLFDAHINVEFCSSVKSIKYVCKYINKGSDAAMFALRDSNDEVSQFQMGRYLSTSEAFWRIFDFPIHDRHPTVVRLAVHLENGQRVYFTENNAQQVAAAPPKETSLTSFFTTCQNDEFARSLLYLEMPAYYTWANNRWSRRKRGSPVDGQVGVFKDTALGRLYTVHPSQHECFYLRVLLLEVRGPESFESLRTIDGEVCTTFRQSALQRGLIEDDRQWEATLSEASVSRTPRCMRSLFAVLLQMCGVSDPNGLWMQFREDMSEDFRWRQQRLNPDVEVAFNEDIFNQALVAIEDKILAHGGLELHTFGLPRTTRIETVQQPREILRETTYDRDILADVIASSEAKLLPEQRHVFDTIMGSVNGAGGIFFLDAPGGTGKTFLINLILARIRIQGKIVIAVASSGIAATLLPGGRTAHSAFKLPLNLTVNDLATCNIAKGTGLARLLRSCVMIVWDECTMSHKHAFEALDRTLQDIRECNAIMGGVTLLLSGDFRQTLPVIPRGTRADMVRASLRSSYLWRSVRSLHLTTNMRAHSYNDEMATSFASDLLHIGNGEFHGSINLSECTDCCCVGSCDALIGAVFGDLVSNMSDSTWLCERAILAPKNDTVDAINRKMLAMVPGEIRASNSIDSIPDPSDVVNYPTEFLNSLSPTGMPPHELFLKEGVPIMLLRNMEPPKLCNGTRLLIRKIMPHLIEAEILTGCGKGEYVFIPRIPLIPTDSPIEFRRLQFPVKLSFAMTINKSQGQTLKVAGLQLEEPCFSHGQLYVAMSRVGWPGNLHINAPDNATINVVYREALGLSEIGM